MQNDLHAVIALALGRSWKHAEAIVSGVDQGGHYADVRALVVDTVAAATDELAQAMMPALLAADSRAAAVDLVEAVSARRGVFRSLFSGAGDVLRAELSLQVMHRLDALPDLSPSWLPRKLATRLAVTGTIEVLDWWPREEPGMGTGDVARLLERVVMAPHGGAPPLPPATLDEGAEGSRPPIADLSGVTVLLC